MQKERIDVKSMSVQRRTDYTYGKVHSLYENKVAEAEGLRQRTADTPLNILLSKFASVRTQQNLEEGLRKRVISGADVKQATQTVDLGMAGLFRMGHVHENSMVTRDPVNSVQHIQKAYNWHDRHESPISVRRTTNVVNQTIHGGAIYWKGETTQDLLRTLHQDGGKKLPTDNLEEEMRSELRVLFSDNNLTNSEKKRKKAVGIISSLGMIAIQRARDTRDLAEFTLGFAHILWADRMEKSDPHRTATVALWSAAYSVDPRYGGESLRRRFQLAMIGSVEFLKVLLSPDYKSAISSLKQAIKRKV